MPAYFGGPLARIELRYRDHADYVRRVEEAVKRLVGERLLLAEDGDQMIGIARSPEIAQRFGR